MLVWERVCPNAVSVEVSVSVKMYHAEQFVRPYVLYQVCVSECMWYLCLCVCVSVRVVPPEGHKEGRPRDVPLRSSVVTPEDGGQIDELFFVLSALPVLPYPPALRPLNLHKHSISQAGTHY